MKHLKKFNENTNNNLSAFYYDYEQLFQSDEEFEQGYEPSKADLWDSVGELINKHHLTREQIKEILDDYDTNFDVDGLLKATYEDWYEEEGDSSDNEHEEPKLYTRQDLINFATTYQREYENEHVGSAEAFVDTWIEDMELLKNM